MTTARASTVDRIPALGSQPQPGYANGRLEVAAPLPAVQASNSGLHPAAIGPTCESRLGMSVPPLSLPSASSPRMIVHTAEVIA